MRRWREGGEGRLRADDQVSSLWEELVELVRAGVSGETGEVDGWDSCGCGLGCVGVDRSQSDEDSFPVTVISERSRWWFWRMRETEMVGSLVGD